MFSKSKTEDCDQKVWNVFDQFGIIIPYSARFCQEVDVHVSLKVAAKAFFRGKSTVKI